MKVSFDPSFRRAFKKKVSRNEILQKKFYEHLEIFTKDPFDSRLKTHKLTGELEGLLSFRIDTDIRVIFFFQNKEEAVFIDIGTHDEVY